MTGGYKKMEDAVVGGFNKVADSFVDAFVAREGESVADAKARLTAEQQARKAAAKADLDQRAADQKARIDASLEASKNAGKRR